MDVREKLVELLLQEDGVCEPSDCKYCGVKGSCGYYRTADRLIANGVTVQEWISVDDRLPGDEETVIICTNKNFVYAGELIGDTWFLDNDSWTATVTNWMPLPQPPKGE